MSWVALLLIGAGLADLLCSISRRPRVSAVAAASVVVVVALLAGQTGGALVGVLLIAVAVVVWEESVTRGFAGGRARLPLAVLGGAVAAALALSATAPPVGGPVADLLAASAWPLVADLPPERALLVAGVLLVQLSTGNVLVRLVLTASGTTNPLRDPHATVPAALKGGRLLGPMERLLIVGFGLAGDLTAASVVIAAKGLLRFPELQASRGGRGRPGIHEVTEYFLVGSFVSWTVALTGLVLVAT